MKTSAYMIAHCDDDFLEQAIASVIDRVDELVFVDGAYRWVAPFFEAAGIDPARSWQRTHDILSKFAPKIRYFSGLWDDELHKRSFAWSQCEGDVIIRIDADEILHFDDEAFVAFLMSDKGVGQMEIPFMLTPHSERLKIGLDETPCLCAVFKASHFRSPVQHCAYLWLILTEAERKRCGAMNPDYVYQPALIKTAHLTGMRTPRTAVNRARFYTLHYVRQTGQLQWAYAQTPVSSPEEKIGQIFNLMSADEYTSYLEGHEIVSGFALMQGFRVAPYHFDGTPVQAQLDAAYDVYNAGLADLLDFAARPRTVVSGTHTIINVTSLIRKGVTAFEVEFADPVQQAPAHLQFLLDRSEEQSGSNLAPVFAKVDGKVACYSFNRVEDARVLQAVLFLTAKTEPPRNKTQIVRLTIR